MKYVFYLVATTFISASVVVAILELVSYMAGQLMQ